MMFVIICHVECVMIYEIRNNIYFLIFFFTIQEKVVNKTWRSIYLLNFVFWTQIMSRKNQIDEPSIIYAPVGSEYAGMEV